MGKTRSIISANIDSDLVRQMQMKTKGTRSRIIERAIRAYLAGESDFTVFDVPTDKIVAVLLGRLRRESNYNSTPLILLLEELVQ